MRVPRTGRRPTAADYDLNVFINCPFDDLYLPMFRALTFAVFECGLRPRCAQEVYDAGEVRIEKIGRIITGLPLGHPRHIEDGPERARLATLQYAA